ncbi:MAG: ABC transporter substrate-binding protein, partial [Pseudomonadota bacterium]
APNPDIAVKFLDYLLRPEVAGAISVFARVQPAIKNLEDYVPKDILTLHENNPIPEAGPPVFIQSCRADVQSKYDEIWVKFRSQAG